GPLLWESGLVLNRRLYRHRIALVMARVVDRALPGGAPNLEDENGLIRPAARFRECAVRGAVDEHVVEQRIALIRLVGATVGHARAGPQEDPLAIVFRQDELAVRRELGPVGRVRLRGQ